MYQFQICRKCRNKGLYTSLPRGKQEVMTVRNHQVTITFVFTVCRTPRHAIVLNSFPDFYCYSCNCSALQPDKHNQSLQTVVTRRADKVRLLSGSMLARGANSSAGVNLALRGGTAAAVEPVLPHRVFTAYPTQAVFFLLT